MLRARLGVRTRILAIALIPSLALLVIGVGAAGYLVNEGQNAKRFADTLQSSIGPTNDMIHAVQEERLLSLWQLGGTAPDPQALAAARTQLDSALQTLSVAETKLSDNSSGKMQNNIGGFDVLKTQLPQLRGAIDARALPIDQTYGVYTKLLDAVAQGTTIVQQSAPNATVASGLSLANQLLYAMEAYSGATALTGAVMNGGVLTPELSGDLRNFAGYYQSVIPQLATQFGGALGQALTALTTTPAWQQSTVTVEGVLHPAILKNGEREPWTMSSADWRSAADQVNQALLDQWVAQNRIAEHLATDAGAASTRNSLLAGIGALAISVIAFLVALWLANRLIGRLTRLRTETLALAEVRLPETMRRLSAGEDIDPETEAARLDFGTDEIGTVAQAFNQAHTAAVTAAITEAKTREGVRAVFLNIAHRSQIVVHRQLELLDEAESRQEDPALLDIFFRLDHLATRERRNAENLIILGGGQPGRQWRRPVPLVELVRSAVGETLDYARVRTARMPQVFVVGNVVADLIHLLAELVDNATAFSPPQSRVDLTGNRVGKGLVVEIIDQGMGISAEDVERHNQMLREPPDFGVAALSADSRLGLFVVAQLGARHGITVRLSESDYGGIRAIVLIPTAVITVDAPVADHLPDRMPVRRIESPDTGEMRDSAGEMREIAGAPVAVAIAPPPEPVYRDEQQYADPRYDDPRTTEDARYTGDRRYAEEPRRAEPPRYGNEPLDTDAPDMGWATQIPDQPAIREQYRTGEIPQSAEDSAAAEDSRARHARPSYTGADARPPLPRRRRQASLAPELSKEPEQPEQPPAAGPPTGRSAEQARDLMSAIENGTRQGRRATPEPASPRDEQEGEGDYLQRR